MHERDDPAGWLLDQFEERTLPYPPNAAPDSPSNRAGVASAAPAATGPGSAASLGASAPRPIDPHPSQLAVPLGQFPWGVASAPPGVSPTTGGRADNGRAPTAVSRPIDVLASLESTDASQTDDAMSRGGMSNGGISHGGMSNGARRRRDGRGAEAGTAPLPHALVWTATALAIAVVIVGSVLLATRLPGSTGGSGGPVAGPGGEVPAVPASGPLPAGEYAWSELLGGECIDPFESAWQERYTVVACDAEHAAQLLGWVPVPSESADIYPGVEAIGAEIAVACGASGLLDSAAADEYGDIIVQARFPMDEQAWADGHRRFGCFAARASGDPLTTSVTPDAATVSGEGVETEA